MFLQAFMNVTTIFVECKNGGGKCFNMRGFITTHGNIVTHFMTNFPSLT